MLDDLYALCATHSVLIFTVSLAVVTCIWSFNTMPSILRSLVFATVALLLAFDALAAWEPLGQNQNVTLEIDAQRVHKRDGLIAVWTNFKYLSDQPRPGNSNQTYRSRVVLYGFDCQSRTATIISMIYYKGEPNSEIVESVEVPLRSRRESGVIPGSALELVFLRVCTGDTSQNSNQPNLEAQFVFARVSNYVATIKTDSGSQGSAVMYLSLGDRGSLLVTNCHVLKGASKINVFIAGLQYDGAFFDGNSKLDLCRIHIPRIAPQMDFGSYLDLQIGDVVFAIGSPKGLELTLSNGIISQKRGDFFSPPLLIQTTAAISPGSSGGGLFDAMGRLVGITTFKIREADSLNFAISANMLNGFHDQAKVKRLADLK